MPTIPATQTTANHANHDLEAWLRLLAHDVRAPLQIIEGYARLLESDVKSAPHRAALAHVQDAATQLHILLEDVLSAIEPRRDRHVPAKENRADLTLALAEVDERARGLAELRGVPLSVSVPDSTLWVHGHPVTARHAILNVVVNAIHHGGGRVCVEAPILEARHVLVVVRDEGHGLPDDLQVTKEASNLGPDTDPRARRGRGLSIASNLMRDMGGDLHYAPSRSHPGTFMLRFPRKTGDPPTTPDAPTWSQL